MPRASVAARIRVADVQGTLSGPQHGAGFVLFINNGLIHMLEGYTYDESWPSDIKSFELRYIKLPRDQSMLDSVEG